ncbi:MAG TPA: TIGR02281 family clan AA aspartic protease [Mesorhizobium sp.]|jgi:aspartyl protease family protein|nr:TIGR02281 family clan AA aspartic protease [Mesorhizobium sp.]
MSRLFWVLMAVLGGGLSLLLLNNDAGSTFGVANDDFARMVFLGAIGLLIAAGLFRRGSMGGAGLRSAALWLLILLALVGGYQYRYELQDVASRLTAGLVPGSPLAFQDEDGRAAVMLQRGLAGHFEAQVTVNGEPVTMLVDTGASATVLTARDAARIGLDPESLSFTVPVATANGTARAARAVAEEIAVGEIVRRRVPLLVAQPDALDQSLLGMNFIGTLTGFDMRGDRLILRD